MVRLPRLSPKAEFEDMESSSLKLWWQSEPSLVKEIVESQFETKICGYEVGAENFDILQVMDGYALLDDADDSKIPYWAEIWPSAIALSEAILEEPMLEGQMYLELGAGLGLTSCVAAHRGARVIATDYLAEPLAFAKVNGHLNGVALDVEMLNWLKPPPPRRFDTILAADILYSESNVKPVARLLAKMIDGTNRALLSDPQRAHLKSFLQELSNLGVSAEREEKTLMFEGVEVTLDIYCLIRE